MKCLILNCTLKANNEESNTEALAKEVQKEFNAQGVFTEMHRLSEYNIPPGVKTNERNGDQWPYIHEKILNADIFVIASPTWLGRPSSIAQRALERMDAMITEETAEGLPVAYNKVAGAIATGNEDGAHHVISEIFGALIDIGFSIPGQAWTYWNKGPGPGENYLETDQGHEWSITTGKTAASVMTSLARALKENPIPPTAYKTS